MDDEQRAVEEMLMGAVAQHEAGRLAEAEALYRRILTVNPTHPDALNLLGVLAAQAGQIPQAVDLIQRAIQLCRGVPYFRFTLANALRAGGRKMEALESYRLADQLGGGADVNVLHSLGDLLRELGEFANAAAAYRRVLELRPQSANVHNDLGICLQQLRRLDDAIECYEAALKLDGSLALTWNNLTFALIERGQADEALAAAENAVRMGPRVVEAHNALAFALKHQGRLEEAVAALRAGLAIDPRNHALWGSLLVTLHCVEADGAAILSEHREWYHQCAQPLAPLISPHQNTRDPNRRIRIGYVSPDFRMNPVAIFLLPLLEAHDRHAFEITCYSDVFVEDDITARLRQSVDHWRDITKLSDAQLVERIRGDGVDVLVDLSSHTSRNRLLAFAQKPAPVQLSYLGYPSTTGLPAVDYRVSEANLETENSDDFYVEPPLLLEGGYFCLTPNPAAGEVSALPAMAKGHVTFGCLGMIKMTRRALEIWRDVLVRVADAHLLLCAHRGSHRQRLRDHFAAAGVDPSRIEFVGYQRPGDYFATYGRIDIALDTFPYCGGTTTCDALWMGVPVVTLAGKTGVQRMGVSILRNAGLQNLIAQDEAEYLRIAAELAADVSALADMRATMRDQLRGSPLMDAARYARGVESAFRTAWRRWCEAP